MDPQHAAWNKQQHMLQRALSDPLNHPEWRALFISQHAQLHSKNVSDSEYWSFVDEVLDEMDEAALRVVPPKFEHSVAWILWHLARCEDLTMNLLVAGNEQVLEHQDWVEKLHTPFTHTGNLINLSEITRFSLAIDLDYLKAYRSDIGVSTRQVVSQLAAHELGQRVRPERMERVRKLEDVLDPGIINYWSHRAVAGLLLMPPTRHCFTHLNEAVRIKRALHA